MDKTLHIASEPSGIGTIKLGNYIQYYTTVVKNNKRYNEYYHLYLLLYLFLWCSHFSFFLINLLPAIFLKASVILTSL